MIKEAFASGETLALAKMKACEILGTDEKNIEFEIIQYPSPKMLGIFGGKLAQVKAKIVPSFSYTAKEILNELMYYMGIVNLEFDSKLEDDILYININGENLNYIVGKHGETLDSIQYILNLLVSNSHEGKEFHKIRLNAGNYREQRKKTLENLASRLAHKVISNHQDVALEPMKSYERKIIHDTIQTIDGVYSWSEGINDKRHIIISENQNKKYH